MQWMIWLQKSDLREKYIIFEIVDLGIRYEIVNKTKQLCMFALLIVKVMIFI